MPACHGSGPRQCRRLPTAEAGTRLSTQRYEQRLTQTFLDQLLPPDCRHTRNTDEPKTWLRSPLTVAVLPVAGMRSKTATRWRRTGATAIPVHYRRAFPQLKATIVGLAGLEPAASSLSGFCTEPVSAGSRWQPARTTYRWRPLRTAQLRWRVDQTWTRPSASARPRWSADGCTAAHRSGGDASTAGPWPWVADGQPCSASHTLANAAA
jgi:hypothetical protein